VSKSQTEIGKGIDRLVTFYFTGARERATEVNIPSLNQRVALQLDGGREVYVSIPFDPNATPPNWEAITEYARQHSETRLLLWLNGQIKEL